MLHALIQSEPPQYPSFFHTYPSPSLPLFSPPLEEEPFHIKPEFPYGSLLYWISSLCRPSLEAHLTFPPLSITRIIWTLESWEVQVFWRLGGASLACNMHCVTWWILLTMTLTWFWIHMLRTALEENRGPRQTDCSSFHATRRLKTHCSLFPLLLGRQLTCFYIVCLSMRKAHQWTTSHSVCRVAFRGRKIFIHSMHVHQPGHPTCSVGWSGSVCFVWEKNFETPVP